MGQNPNVRTLEQGKKYDYIKPLDFDFGILYVF
jgi:hypothetical protein